MDVIAVASDLAERGLLVGIQRGEFITESEITSSDERQAAIGGFQFLMLLAAGIAFIVWFHRAYHNVISYGISKPPYGPGWAIGGWLIPIGNLFIPKRIANTIWTASDPQLASPVGTEWKSRR